jgi:hypothetical protein
MRFILFVFSLFPVAAFAHEGDHSYSNILQNLFHLVTEPDHIMMAAGAGALVGLVIYLRKRWA